jgi:hypothetical protein
MIKLFHAGIVGPAGLKCGSGFSNYFAVHMKIMMSYYILSFNVESVGKIQLVFVLFYRQLPWFLTN